MASHIAGTLLPAAVKGDVRILKQAIAERVVSVNTTNARHESTLHLVTKYDHLEILKILLENTVNYQAKGRDGNTSLHVAASKGNQVIAKLLLEHGAKKNIKKIKREKHQQTSLKTSRQRI